MSPSHCLQFWATRLRISRDTIQTECAKPAGCIRQAGRQQPKRSFNRLDGAVSVKKLNPGCKGQLRISESGSALNLGDCFWMANAVLGSRLGLSSSQERMVSR